MRKLPVSVALFVAISAVSPVFAASTFNGRYVNEGPGTISVNTSVSGVSRAGALGHEFWNANDAAGAVFTGGAATQAAAATVYTFCIDNRPVSGAVQQYTLQRITDAPVSPDGNPVGIGQYTPDNEKRANAIMLACKSLGYVDSRGFFRYQNITASIPGGLSETQLGAAIQLLVWESVWDETPESHSSGAEVWNLANAEGGGPFTANNTLLDVAVDLIRETAYAIFMDTNTKILARAITTTSFVSGDERGQDQIVLIPLPGAAWAGLGTLGCALGLAYARRRRHAVN